MSLDLDPSILEKRKNALSRYISNPDGNFFVLMDLGVSGIAGAAYARYSRAKGSFRETFVKEFLDNDGNIKTSKLEVLERILLEFGDESVGELEGAHSSWERISNLATKKIEDKRIGGSPIEQSSRYVVYDMTDEKGDWFYLREPRIMESRFASKYLETMDFLFSKYVSLVKNMRTYFEAINPLNEFKTKMRVNNEDLEVKLHDLSTEQQIRDFKTIYNFVMKTSACDRARVILPAATLTNVGIFGNGRFYKNLLKSLYSDDLSEMQKIADKQHQELNKVIEVYVRGAKRDEYLVNTRKNMEKLSKEILNDVDEWDSKDDVILVDYDHKNIEDYIIAQCLFKFAEHPIEQLRHIVKNLPQEKKEEILNTYIGERRDKRDRPGRALENGYPLSFEVVSDFGVYRDLHRHRMLTQERQNLTVHLGYTIPNEIQEAGWEDDVKECYSKSGELYSKLVEDYPEEAQYATLFGHKIRYFMGMNFREAMHMWELRTIPQGHPNYRKICQKMHTLTMEKYPLLGGSMKFVNYNQYVHARAGSESRITIKLQELRDKYNKDIDRSDS